MDMTIGIVTIIDNDNFGNRLQNYAVYRFFKKEYGIRADTLATHKNGRNKHGAMLPGLKESAVLMLSHFPHIMEKRFSPNVNRRVSFLNWSSRIPTKHYYNSVDIPKEVGNKYDILFAGSDQIWNYSISSNKFYNYFLQFASPSKRASVSASFGVGEIPEEWRQRYIEGLSGMKYISVREDAGAKIVKEFTGRDVPVLVDPVMMLDREEWLAVARRPRVDCSVPYVLKYYLGDEDDKKIDRWAEQRGYRVYELMKKDNPALYSAGPGEFLSLIDKAALVCSDSFHCIAFSILMRKPFVVFARKGKHSNMSSRMDTLLGKFGFQDRWDTLLSEENYLKCDFSKLDDRLEMERRKFRTYIAGVMSGEDQAKVHLADKQLCTGCTACAKTCPRHCIEMKPDKNGFRYPVIDNAGCVGCGACEKICPVLNPEPRPTPSPRAFAAYSLDDHVRMCSSSGGIFSELAKTVLAERGAVYGAAYDESFAVKHICVENVNELSRLRGAKYAESHLEDTFTEIESRLKSGQQVLFSGTPCQVAGLKAFLSGEYPNLLCVDFVCHGVPSPVAWEKYVAYRAQTDSAGVLPVEINLRDKSTGWSHYRYSNLFRYPGGSEHRDISTQSVYMKLFTGDYISRLSCGDCKFKGYSRSSDITIGDFWGIWDIAPEMDDDRGTSVVLIQSEKGQRAWDKIGERVRIKDVTLEQASKNNSSIICSSTAKDNRDAVLEKIRSSGFASVMNADNHSSARWRRVVREVNRVLRNGKN